MYTDISEPVYDAWLASSAMPARLLMEIYNQYGKASNCYDAFLNHGKEIDTFIPSRFYRILEQNSSEQFLSQMKKSMGRNDIQVLHMHDTQYPDSLKSICDPPPLLFYQGDLTCLKEKMVAMVGSRVASYIGQKAAEKIAEALSHHGVSVISGLACGIDAASHRGCLLGSSPTIAVTGCGLDRVYPVDNGPLRNEILDKNGLILSEYAPGERPLGWHFPVRNRIISGLAHALVLIEARIRSGSMTSVQHALDQGKDVFVYPGDPSSDHFEGNHQLLREGGLYFTSAEDILEDLGWLDNPPAVRHNIDCSLEQSSATKEQSAVIQALKPGSLSFEQLLKITDLNPSVLMSTLTILQISGLIEALPGKQYQLNQ